ncbi:hypothetical protein D7V86_02255 [bacterium D16-51]|nr:hypothetical protein D7V96_01680 [bacterium D16-59]RKI62362.1 hypothetical protein D7V86_02255 [bacterium D16-51]
MGLIYGFKKYNFCQRKKIWKPRKATVFNGWILIRKQPSLLCVIGNCCNRGGMPTKSEAF